MTLIGIYACQQKSNPSRDPVPLYVFFHAGACWVRGGLPVGGVPQEDQEPGRSPLPLSPQGRVQACFQGHSFIYFVMSKYPVFQCCGSGMFIPGPGYEFFANLDPNCFHPGSAPKNLIMLTQKMVSKL
jgi:hypothetical protein